MPPLSEALNNGAGFQQTGHMVDVLAGSQNEARVVVLQTLELGQLQKHGFPRTASNNLPRQG